VKTVSVKDISKLESDGWKIKPADKNAITGQIAVVKAAAAIAVSLEHIKSSIENVEFPNADNSAIEKLLDNNYSVLSQLITTLQRPASYTFEVKRDSKGFIDKVVVT
jgi:hypothetical protein